MAGLQKNKVKLSVHNTKMRKAANLGKESNGTGAALQKPKQTANKKATKTVKKNVPMVFVSANRSDSDGEESMESDEPSAPPAPKLPRLEPVPTDVPDPQLPPRSQKLLRPLIGYIYNGEQMSLKLSFEQAGLLLEHEYNETTKVFRFVIDTKEICRAVGEKEEAHSEARQKLVQIIRYYCYTVKRIKEYHTRRKIFYTRPPNAPKEKGSAKAIQEENIGFQMLQRQGWSGGGLGTGEDGIIEPIGVKRRKGKSGLGTDNVTTEVADGERPKKEKIPLEAFYMMMKQYAGVNALYDLVFSTQFTKQQVAKLRMYANSLKLFSQMIGHKKRLVVSRPLTIKQIKAGVIKGHTDLCAKYVVIPPAAGIPDEDKVLPVAVKPERTRVAKAKAN